MRQLSIATRTELLEALRQRYGDVGRVGKTRILDEFVSVTGYHRKHAVRLLCLGASSGLTDMKPRRGVYSDAVREALVVMWEASDRICGKRLHALLPSLVGSMERHGHLELCEDVRVGFLAMSAATIDRQLCGVREAAGGRRRRRTLPPSSVRRRIPVRTGTDWQDPAPGFMEGDLVAHSGPVARGSFLQTLVVTDIATGWTECAPVLYREQTLVREVLEELRKRLPFDLLGFDVDKDSVFMNETLLGYYEDREIELTRCRPWHENDQAFVEQKNGAVVRRIVGYRRLEGLAAAAALSRLYGTVRLFVNFFQPSFKLLEKTRDGARVRKRYHRPATPCQRLLADPRTPQAVRDATAGQLEHLDPVRLLQQMRRGQQEIADLADGVLPQEPAASEAASLDDFFAALRTAWKDGDVRPTARPKAQPKRGRRRPDPLEKVTYQLRTWFDADPCCTSRQLLEQLQTEQPGLYPDHLLRTLQRRVKTWRKEKVHEMIFGYQVNEAALPDVHGHTNAACAPTVANAGYPRAPAARSRSSWPVSTQLWIVRRFTPNRLDSSAFETPRSR